MGSVVRMIALSPFLVERDAQSHDGTGTGQSMLCCVVVQMSSNSARGVGPSFLVGSFDAD